MPIAIRAFNNTQTLGDALRGLRLAIPRTLSEMADATKIQKTVLEAFEANDFCKLPPTSYARQFLKTYVRALGGNQAYFLQRFNEECGTCDIAHVALLSPRRARTGSRLTPSRLLKATGITAAALAVAIFLGCEVNNITSPPSLAITFPADGYVTQNAVVQVTGSADPKAVVYVNGTEVFPNPDGTFATTVDLQRGLNVISVNGAKRYSRSAETERHVVLEQDENTAALGNITPSNTN